MGVGVAWSAALIESDRLKQGRVPHLVRRSGPNRLPTRRSRQKYASLPHQVRKVAGAMGVPLAADGGIALGIDRWARHRPLRPAS